MAEPLTRPRRSSTVAAAVSAVLSAVALAHAVFRAQAVPLTFDEAGVFHTNVAAGVGAVLDFATAQNHLLQTAVSWALYRVVDPIWALRIPSLVGGLVYAACVIGLVTSLNSGWVAVAGGAILLSNPYLFEYFALGRGYGLAVGLLVASVWCHLRWLTHDRRTGPSTRPLAMGCGLAALAVAANFTVLPVVLGLVGLACLRIAWHPYEPSAESSGRVSGPLLAALWVAVTAVYSFQVFARERVLAPRDLAPITVTVTGAYDEELALVRVFRKDQAGVMREMVSRSSGRWTGSAGHYPFEALRVVLPSAVERNLASLDVVLGGQTFARDRRSPGPWTAVDAGRDRLLTSTPVVRWRADAEHYRRAAWHAALTTGLLGVLGAGLAAAAAGGSRAGIVPAAEGRVLVAAMLTVAGVAAAPLYLLRRDGELFFGGSTGLVEDTARSLIEATYYGRDYHPAQVAVAMVGCALAVAALPVVGFINRRTPAPPSPSLERAAFLLALIGLACAQFSAQHVLLGTPFPLSRTALYLLPLFLWYVVLVADAAAAKGGVPRAVVAMLVTALAAGSVVHGARVANAESTRDWPRDAATREAVLRATRTAAEPPTVPGRIRLGVDRLLYPVARFYADRASSAATRYEVQVLPGDGVYFDFVYGAPSAAHGEVLATYARAGVQLSRARH